MICDVFVDHWLYRISTLKALLVSLMSCCGEFVNVQTDALIFWSSARLICSLQILRIFVDELNAHVMTFTHCEFVGVRTNSLTLENLTVCGMRQLIQQHVTAVGASQELLFTTHADWLESLASVSITTLHIVYETAGSIVNCLSADYTVICLKR